MLNMQLELFAPSLPTWQELSPTEQTAAGDLIREMLVAVVAGEERESTEGHDESEEVDHD